MRILRYRQKAATRKHLSVGLAAVLGAVVFALLAYSPTELSAFGSGDLCDTGCEQAWINYSCPEICANTPGGTECEGSFYGRCDCNGDGDGDDPGDYAATGGLTCGECPDSGCVGSSGGSGGGDPNEPIDEEKCDWGDDYIGWEPRDC